VQGDGQVGEEPEVLRGAGRLTAGLGDRQAGVERLEFGDPLGAGLDAVRDLGQDAGPFASGHRGPGTFGEGVAGHGDGVVDVGRAARGDGGVRPVGHRVRDLERRAVSAGDVRAADEVLELGGNGARCVRGLDGGLELGRGVRGWALCTTVTARTARISRTGAGGRLGRLGGSGAGSLTGSLEH